MSERLFFVKMENVWTLNRSTNLYNVEAFSGESGDEESTSNNLSNFLANILLFKESNNVISGCAETF